MLVPPVKEDIIVKPKPVCPPQLCECPEFICQQYEYVDVIKKAKPGKNISISNHELEIINFKEMDL